jgi:FtsZ-binding cell division protein ZapB
MDAESFEQDNLDYISKMRSSNARMFMVLMNFETTINSTISALSDEKDKQELHKQVQKLSSDMTYRLKDMQSTLDLDFTASDSRLKHAGEKIGKLLDASKRLSAPNTNKRTVARVKESLRSWTKTGHLKVKLPSFAEVVKKSKEKKAAQSELTMKKLKAAVKQHLKEKSEAGAKRKKLEESNRKMQMKLQAMFERVRGLPNVDVSPATLLMWRDYVKSYNSVLRSHKGSFGVSWQDRLKSLASKMTAVLKSPDGQTYVRRMFKSTFFRMKTKMPDSMKVDQKFVDTQTKSHPFRTFQQLAKVAAYTAGKDKVLDIEQKLRSNKMTSFEAWIALRKLMNLKQAPKQGNNLFSKRKRSLSTAGKQRSALGTIVDKYVH